MEFPKIKKSEYAVLVFTILGNKILFIGFCERIK